MEYGYEKLMAEYELTVSDLPQRAKVGIGALAQIEKAMRMATSQGKKVSESTMEKIETYDTWVCNEILDLVEETDENKGEEKPDAAEIIEEIKKDDETPEEKANKALGMAIELELENLYKSENKVFELDNLKALAPKTWNVLWTEYEDDKPNGIVTNKFEIKETSENQFTIKTR